MIAAAISTARYLFLKKITLVSIDQIHANYHGEDKAQLEEKQEEETRETKQETTTRFFENVVMGAISA